MEFKAISKGNVLVLHPITTTKLKWYIVQQQYASEQYKWDVYQRTEGTRPDRHISETWELEVAIHVGINLKDRREKL